jgi:hypothetical protein
MEERRQGKLKAPSHKSATRSASRMVITPIESDAQREAYEAAEIRQAQIDADARLARTVHEKLNLEAPKDLNQAGPSDAYYKEVPQEDTYTDAYGVIHRGPEASRRRTIYQSRSINLSSQVQGAVPYQAPPPPNNYTNMLFVPQGPVGPSVNQTFFPPPPPSQPGLVTTAPAFPQCQDSRNPNSLMVPMLNILIGGIIS